MRPSKSRSRNKSNRSRSMGNIVNRVFDSSGPEGKVRGTPQQIIDKYNQLARDAQLGNDRVAAENFQQHAEHYMRMLGEAQREQDARRDQQQDGQPGQQGQQGQQPQQGQQQGRGRDRGEGDQPEVQGRRDDRQDEDMRGGADVIDMADDDEGSTLVETPEEKPAPKPRRARKPRAPKAEEGAQPAETADAVGEEAQPPAAE